MGVDNSVIVMVMVIIERLGAYCVLSIHADHVRTVDLCVYVFAGVIHEYTFAYVHVCLCWCVCLFVCLCVCMFVLVCVVVCVCVCFNTLQLFI